MSWNSKVSRSAYLWLTPYNAVFNSLAREMRTAHLWGSRRRYLDTGCPAVEFGLGHNGIASYSIAPNGSPWDASCRSCRDYGFALPGSTRTCCIQALTKNFQKQDEGVPGNGSSLWKYYHCFSMTNLRIKDHHHTTTTTTTTKKPVRNPESLASPPNWILKQTVLHFNKIPKLRK